MTVNICQDFTNKKYYIGLGMDCSPFHVDGIRFYDTEEDVVNVLIKLGYSVTKERIVDGIPKAVLGWVVKPERHPNEIYHTRVIVYSSDIK